MNGKGNIYASMFAIHKSTQWWQQDLTYITVVLKNTGLFFITLGFVQVKKILIVMLMVQQIGFFQALGQDKISLPSAWCSLNIKQHSWLQQ